MLKALENLPDIMCLQKDCDSISDGVICANIVFESGIDTSMLQWHTKYKLCQKVIEM